MARKNVAEKAAQRRNYRKLQDRLYEIAEPYGLRYKSTILGLMYRLVRERFGCRATEIRDGEIEAALAFVHDLHCLVEIGKGWRETAAREDSAHALERRWREAQAREDPADARARREASDAAMRWLAQRIQGRPTLQLVPDCGRDLGRRGE